MGDYIIHDGILYSEDELRHYGVLGMKWGVRRTPEQLGRKLLKKAKTSNMEKWGKDPNHNVAYIGGYSGSGKSTLANTLADKNTNVIHLDSYFDKQYGGSDPRSKEFDEFLIKKGIKAPNEVSPKKWSSEKTFDKFEDSIEAFGREQYKKGKKVIAEGVQVVDDGIRVDKKFFSDKPLILLTTGALTSIRRARERDGMNKQPDLEKIKEYISTYTYMNKRLDDISLITSAKKGREFINQYLNYQM